MTSRKRSLGNKLIRIAEDLSKPLKISEIKVNGDVILGSGIVEGILLPTLILGGARGFEISPPDDVFRSRIEKLSDDEIWNLLCYCTALLIQTIVGDSRGLGRNG